MTVKDLVASGRPYQVQFWDDEGYCAGILVGRQVICGCCGALYDIDEIIESATEDDVAAILLFDTWVDISAEIAGDEVGEALVDE